MIRSAATCLLLAAIGLSGCGSDPLAKRNFDEMRGVLKSSAPAKAKQASAGTAAPLTRAALNQIGAPVVRVTLDSRNAVATLGRLNGNSGTVTWATSDGITATFRQGVLIETRGLGPDLMSAAVPSAATLAAGTGTHERVHYYLDGDDSTVRRDYRCDMSLVGPEVIEIVELRYSTRHVTETCRSSAGKITNHYWIEPNGHIRQSLQWISQGVGYMKLERLID